jgi:hypothetical protein
VTYNPKSKENLRPPWKPGQSGNPKGRLPGRSFEELVGDAMAKIDPASGELRREALAEKFAEELLKKRERADFELYMRRVWPEVSKHELTADVDISQQVADAAEELDRLLDAHDNRETETEKLQ